MLLNKILFIYKYYSYGGTESAIKNRIYGLKEKGINSDCLFLTKKSDGIFENDTNVYFLDSNSISNIDNILKNDYSVISIIDTPEVYSYIKQRKNNFKIINECHTSNIEYLKYVTDIDNKNSIDAFVVPSYFSKKLLKEVFKIKMPVYVINNCIDREHAFYFRDDFNEYFIENTVNNIPILCWIGRLEEAKNPIEFLKIVNLLKKKHKIKAWIIGGNKYSHMVNEVIRQIYEYDLINIVKWFPSLPYSYMPYIYSAVSYSGGCLVSTSLRECYPMIFLEAMSCKCPVICTNVGGNSEIIKNNVTGIMYNVGDIFGATTAIEKILNDNNLRTKIINNALEFINMKNSFEKCTKDFIEILLNMNVKL